MAGLDPAIHVLFKETEKDVDARNKRGHDRGYSCPPSNPCLIVLAPV
jgi:hypothetical protein